MAMKTITVGKVYGKGYRLTITGSEAVKKRLLVIKAGHVKAFNKALKEEGDIIYELSQNIVPFLSGALQRSGKVEDGYENKSYVVAIGYGDESVNPDGTPTEKYARYQHEENIEYLEEPLALVEAGMTARIAEKVRGVK